MVIKVFSNYRGKKILIMKHSENRSTKISTHYPKITTVTFYPDIFYEYIFKIEKYI